MLLILIFLSKSFLLITTITFLSSHESNIFVSSSVNSSLLFKTIIIKSASLIKLKLFSTPIFSTISSVSRIPAVSIIFKDTPLIVIEPSTVSRVVPSISVTIAFSSSNNLFKILLFPTFGFPIMIVLIPLVRILPFSDSLIILVNFSFISVIFGFTISLVITIASSYSG